MGLGFRVRVWGLGTLLGLGFRVRGLGSFGSFGIRVLVDEFGTLS